MGVAKLPVGGSKWVWLRVLGTLSHTHLLPPTGIHRTVRPCHKIGSIFYNSDSLVWLLS